jgi:hypothetical protein
VCHSPPSSAEIENTCTYMDIHLHFLKRLHGVVLKYLSMGTTFASYLYEKNSHLLK